MSDEKIDDLCERTRRLFVLWDGAFSYASVLKPSQEDIAQYERFVKVAVDAHVEYGCNVTPKVHLMLKHVAPQMRQFPWGLGNKREDWVEKSHQDSKKVREHLRTARHMDQRATTMAKMVHRDSSPAVIAEIETVMSNSSKGQRKNHVYRAEKRKKARDQARKDVIEAWEAEQTRCPVVVGR